MATELSGTYINSLTDCGKLFNVILFILALLGLCCGAQWESGALGNPQSRGLLWGTRTPGERLVGHQGY